MAGTVQGALVLALLALAVGGLAFVQASRPGSVSCIVCSVANSDGTLTISPTVGGVIASLNLAAANTWLATITSQTIIPRIASNYNLGAFDEPWNNAYFTNMVELLNAAGDTIPMLAWTSLAAHLPCVEFGPGGSTALESGLCRRHTGTLDFLMNTVSTDVFQLTTTGIGNTQGFQSFTCSLAGASTSTVCNLSVAEPDTSYFAVCNVDSATITGVSVSNTSVSTITLSYLVLGVGGGTGTCIVTHQ